MLPFFMKNNPLKKILRKHKRNTFLMYVTVFIYTYSTDKPLTQLLNLFTDLRNPEF